MTWITKNVENHRTGFESNIVRIDHSNTKMSGFKQILPVSAYYHKDMLKIVSGFKCVTNISLKDRKVLKTRQFCVLA